VKLEEKDVAVTNQSDKEMMLPKLEELDDLVRKMKKSENAHIHALADPIAAGAAAVRAPISVGAAAERATPAKLAAGKRACEATFAAQRSPTRGPGPRGSARLDTVCELWPLVGRRGAATR
jgi:hypothetical protein